MYSVEQWNTLRWPTILASRCASRGPREEFFEDSRRASEVDNPWPVSVMEPMGAPQFALFLRAPTWSSKLLPLDLPGPLQAGIPFDIRALGRPSPACAIGVSLSESLCFCSSYRNYTCGSLEPVPRLIIGKLRQDGRPQWGSVVRLGRRANRSGVLDSKPITRNLLLSTKQTRPNAPCDTRCGRYRMFLKTQTTWKQSVAYAPMQTLES